MRLMSRHLPLAMLLLIMGLAVFCYSPGLKGGFLFDDFPNLSDLSAYGGVVDWETFKSFVFNGWSGPSGRPVALASFLLNDNAWPSQGAYFKTTNLLIHLLCGLFLCWSTFLLLRLYGYSSRKAEWIAILTCAFWLLHPFFVSTTLYVVQRMAQLAALFSLVGVVGYLKGRLALQQGLVKQGYWLMSISLILGTVLATLSKENGILLPLLIGVIEFCNPSQNRLDWRWRLLFIWAPSLLVMGVLLSYLNLSAAPWPNRSFNQVERLYSECRIVTEYLVNLIAPRIEGRGLFQDGFSVSSSLLHPLSTLYSLLLLLCLFALALLVRRRIPVLALAIIFFFCAHIVESTLIGLELYFEHRNYLSALFLFLPLALFIVWLKDKISVSISVLMAASIILLLASMTWQRAELWADTDHLEMYWANNTPESPRAQSTIAWRLNRLGRGDDALVFIEQASKRLPDSALLTINWLLLRVEQGIAIDADFQAAALRLSQQPFDAQAVRGMRSLAEVIARERSLARYREPSVELLERMEASSRYGRFALFRRLTPYLKGKLLLSQGKRQQALANYSLAISRYNDTDAAMMMVAEVASSGYAMGALQLLDQAEKVYRQQPIFKLKRSPQIYEAEFERVRALILESTQVQSPYSEFHPIGIVDET